MLKNWQDNIDAFIRLSEKHSVEMLLVGGAAVQFYGYNRNSLDVDFWINPTRTNFDKLIKVFNELGYEITDFPEKVLMSEQNISVKFSPIDLNLELITNFSVNKSFEEAYKSSESLKIGKEDTICKVLSLDDLIISKVRAGRNKDLMDIQELKKIHGNKNNQKRKNRGRSL